MTEQRENPFTNTRIEFHILQSFPVTCLNRDDVGAPKTAVVGGVTRARVSSQAWKRPVRLALQQFGIDKIGIRTVMLEEMLEKQCLDDIESANGIMNEIKEGETEEDKKSILKISCQSVSKMISSNADLSKDRKSNVLMFISEHELKLLASYLKEDDYFYYVKPDKKSGRYSEKSPTTAQKKSEPNKISKHIGDPDMAADGIDIALFGRMVAKAAQLNIEAATSFSHAISTHTVNNEVEFFTALDDRQDEPGSAHMGSLEFNSATYYRYISLDLGQLWQTLQGQDLEKAVAAFTKALFVAIPTARQTTQSGASFWDYSKILVRKGQRLQASFDQPVKQRGEGYLKPSIEQLNNELLNKEKMAGSLFGKIAEYTVSPQEGMNIDELVDALLSHTAVAPSGDSE